MLLDKCGKRRGRAINFVALTQCQKHCRQIARKIYVNNELACELQRLKSLRTIHCKTRRYVVLSRCTSPVSDIRPYCDRLIDPTAVSQRGLTLLSAHEAEFVLSEKTMLSSSFSYSTTHLAHLSFSFLWLPFPLVLVLLFQRLLHFHGS